MRGRTVAIVTLVTASAVSPGRAEPPNDLGSAPPNIRALRELLRNGKIIEASRQAAALAASSPDDPTVHAVLGDVLFRQSRFTEAQDAYHAATNKGKGVARGFWGLGRIAQLKGQAEVARHYFSAAFQRDPRDPDIVLSFADMVRDDQSRSILLNNFVKLAASEAANNRQVADAAARLEIARRIGPEPMMHLIGSEESYDIKLDGYFPSGSKRSGVMLKIRLNGSRPLRLLLDSGAEGILVHQKAVRNTGLERLVNSSIGGLGANRAVVGEVALARNVSAGPLTWENCLVRVTPEAIVPAADGIIGLDMFRSFLVQLDFREQILRLRQFPEDTNEETRPRTPFYQIQHFVLLPTVVNGRDEGYFMLDTGSSFGSVVSPEAAWMIQPREVPIQGAGGLVEDAFSTSPIRLTVGDRELLDPSPVTMNLSGVSQTQGVEISGIIGYPLLQNFVVTINYRDAVIGFTR
jgi:hypothetical protein